MLATHYDIVSVESLPSTQDEAFSRLESSGRVTLVVADNQSAGRGNRARFSPPTGIPFVSRDATTTRCDRVEADAVPSRPRARSTGHQRSRSV